MQNSGFKGSASVEKLSKQNDKDNASLFRGAGDLVGTDRNFSPFAKSMEQLVDTTFKPNQITMKEFYSPKKTIDALKKIEESLPLSMVPMNEMTKEWIDIRKKIDRAHDLRAKNGGYYPTTQESKKLKEEIHTGLKNVESLYAEHVKKYPLKNVELNDEQKKLKNNFEQNILPNIGLLSPELQQRLEPAKKNLSILIANKPEQMNDLYQKLNDHIAGKKQEKALTDNLTTQTKQVGEALNKNLSALFRQKEAIGVNLGFVFNKGSEANYGAQLRFGYDTSNSKTMDVIRANLDKIGIKSAIINNDPNNLVVKFTVETLPSPKQIEEASAKIISEITALKAQKKEQSVGQVQSPSTTTEAKTSTNPPAFLNADRYEFDKDGNLKITSGEKKPTTDQKPSAHVDALIKRRNTPPSQGQGRQ